MSGLPAVEAVPFGGGTGGGCIVLEAPPSWSLAISLSAANVHGYWDVVEGSGGSGGVEGAILGVGGVGGSLRAVGAEVLPSPLSRRGSRALQGPYGCSHLLSFYAFGGPDDQLGISVTEGWADDLGDYAVR